MSLALARRVEETGFEDVAVPIPAGFTLESGDRLPDGEIRVRRHGAVDAPQIVVLGGISAGRNVGGDGGWWSEFVGTGAALNTEAYGVLGVDFAPLTDHRVRITPNDQARLLILALDCLGIERLHAFVGASYGGMVGLAFAATNPGRVERLIVISAAHKPSALGLAWRGVQRRIVEFGLSNGDAEAALSLARQLAMTTYRSVEEFESRFGAGVDADGIGDVDRYLIARGEAYPRAMSPRRWLSLSEAIDRHSVDPARIKTPTTLVACPTDQLIPLADVADLAARLPRLSAFHQLPSLYGHDAFLKEAVALRPILKAALEADAHV